MRARAAAGRRAGQAGFTLIETLVALAILGVVLSAVYGVFGSGLRAASRDEDRLLLALVAQNLLARSRLDLFPADGAALSGDIGGGLRWRIDGEPYALPENLLPEAPEAAAPGDRGAGAAGGGFGRDASGGGGRAGAGPGGGLAGGSGGLGGSASVGRPPSALDEAGSRGGLGRGGADAATGTRAGEGLSDTGAGRAGGTEREREQEKVRLRLVTVTVEKGGERFQLKGLAPEPRRDRGALR